MFKYSTEKQLKEFLITNFAEHFDFSFVKDEHRVSGGFIDILGEDDSAIYVIEIKRDQVSKSTIEQIQKYLKTFPDDKKVIGIAVAPVISKDIVIDNLPDNIWLKSLDTVIYTPKSVPYGTKIDESLKEMLYKLSEATRIPQSKLVDEALEDLFAKYERERK